MGMIGKGREKTDNVERRKRKAKKEKKKGDRIGECIEN